MYDHMSNITITYITTFSAFGHQRLVHSTLTQLSLPRPKQEHHLPSSIAVLTGRQVLNKRRSCGKQQTHLALSLMIQHETIKNWPGYSLPVLCARDDDEVGGFSCAASSAGSVLLLDCYGRLITTTVRWACCCCLKSFRTTSWWKRTYLCRGCNKNSLGFVFSPYFWFLFFSFVYVHVIF